MKKLLLISLLILLLINMGSMNMNSQETLSYGSFGKIYLYKSQTKPSGFVIFASGDGGWTKDVVDMSLRLVLLKNVTLVGINTSVYLSNIKKNKTPLYPAADFENLAKFVEKNIEMEKYLKPVLIGYSSGATLVYATLVQSPPDTFAGAVSLGFCPDLPLNNDFEKGAGLDSEKKTINKIQSIIFKPSKNIKNKWIVLQGKMDETCNFENIKTFVEQTSNAEIIGIDGAGRRLTKESLWINELLSACENVNRMNVNESSTTSDIGDLPLIELQKNNTSGQTAIILTGDGGWTTIDREIGNYLSDKGMGIIGFNTLQYFWNKKNPDITARDLGRVIEFYSNKNKESKILLIGYSLGADVLPFILTRLDKETLKKISGAVFLGISNSVSFEFHITDWIGNGSNNNYKILPEVEKINDVKMLFMGGEKETDTLLPHLDRKKFNVIVLPGGHHFDSNYKKIGDLIFQWAK